MSDNQGASEIEEELKLSDCPFCGQCPGMESVSIHLASDEAFNARWFWIQCDSCGARGPESRSAKEAENGWNREPA